MQSVAKHVTNSNFSGLKKIYDSVYYFRQKNSGVEYE